MENNSCFVISLVSSNDLFIHIFVFLCYKLSYFISYNEKIPFFVLFLLYSSELEQSVQKKRLFFFFFFFLIFIPFPFCFCSFLQDMKRPQNFYISLISNAVLKVTKLIFRFSRFLFFFRRI